MFRSIFAFAALLASLWAQLPAYAQTMDCSALDPRRAVSNQVEGKVSASAATLYKVAQAGGGIEGRLKAESSNLELGSAPTERAVVKPRLIYLFCQMVANSKDFAPERRLELFMQLQRSMLDESLQATAAPAKQVAVNLVRIQLLNNLGKDQQEELVEVYTQEQLLARLQVKRGMTETSFASVLIPSQVTTTYSLVGYTTLVGEDGSTRIVSISGTGKLVPEQDAVYYVFIQDKLPNRHVLYLKRE